MKINKAKIARVLGATREKCLDATGGYFGATELAANNMKKLKCDMIKLKRRHDAKTTKSWSDSKRYNDIEINSWGISKGRICTYISFTKGRIRKTREILPDVFADFDGMGRLVGLEIL